MVQYLAAAKDDEHSGSYYISGAISYCKGDGTSCKHRSGLKGCKHAITLRTQSLVKSVIAICTIVLYNSEAS
jgi:hypothetical protein